MTLAQIRPLMTTALDSSSFRQGTARYRLVGGQGPGAAIALVHIEGDVDHALARLHTPAVGVGEVRLRTVPDVDTLVIARPSAHLAVLCPHAGRAIHARLIAALAVAGIDAASSTFDPRAYPEACDAIEARMLDVLPRAASPLAIDLLLDQPRRFRDAAQSNLEQLPIDAAHALAHLLVPPTVIALGQPNIGKSSLLNALARRSVAVVADMPGTTRDHVGVTLDLAGLVVNYIDTPGIGSGHEANLSSEHQAIDLAAQTTALSLARQANLILLCADARHDPLDAQQLGLDTRRCMLVGIRADLGTPRLGADCMVSSKTGEGISTLAKAIRERLVPAATLNDPRPWQFW